MPTLLESQQALRRTLVSRDNQAAALLLADNIPSDRLDIYRNTIYFSLTRALRLSYPVIVRLVGGEFFDSSAQIFIQEHLPSVACLDKYGDDFSEFLKHFPPAASLAYLADVAKLEWAINCALHAPDVASLDLRHLASISADEQGGGRFVAHPSVRLLDADYPADRIWRAVLAGDDTGLKSLVVDKDPVNLLIERRPGGVEVVRLERQEWNFLKALCDGEPLHSAIDRADELDTPLALADHLAVGRFVGFDVASEKSAAKALA